MDAAYYIGIDVQLRRGCAYYVFNQHGATQDSGWVVESSAAAAAKALREVVEYFEGHQPGSSAIGIDAPRQPLPKKRPFYWDRRAGDWRKRKASEKGHGRHCEAAIKALGIANPQWTPTRKASPAWMKLGYKLFDELGGKRPVHEVFPSASYALLDQDRLANVALNLAHFAPGPKDMLDACVAAFTVREFVAGRGFEIGGGDGLGAIVLPRQPGMTLPKELLRWPTEA